MFINFLIVFFITFGVTGVGDNECFRLDINRDDEVDLVDSTIGRVPDRRFIRGVEVSVISNVNAFLLIERRIIVEALIWSEELYLKYLIMEIMAECKK